MNDKKIYLNCDFQMLNPVSEMLHQEQDCFSQFVSCYWQRNKTCHIVLFLTNHDFGKFVVFFILRQQKSLYCLYCVGFSSITLFIIKFTKIDKKLCISGCYLKEELLSCSWLSCSWHSNYVICLNTGKIKLANIFKWSLVMHKGSYITIEVNFSV